MELADSTLPEQRYPLLTPAIDLVISQSESEEGEKSYIIKEPVSEHFVSLGEIEYFIFQQIDGKTPLEIIQLRVQKTFDAEMPINQLNAFLNSLWKRGFLLIDGDESTHQAKKKGRFGGNILYMRFRAFNPDRLFDYLITRIQFLFTPGFVITATIVILMGLSILFMNMEELTNESARLFQIKTFFIMWLIILPVTTLHEFAHGLTCKNFGGKVSEIGFMLMYFQPAMYCNVSDAWLFSDKNKRLWVGLAGVFFETFLWSLAILTWRVTAPETVLNYLATIFMATSVLRIFFNLNPLIKLDGYYVLSDYLNIPNLRGRTFKYLRSRISYFFHKDDTDMEKVTPRERKIFIIYGPLAVIFTVMILFLIITRIGGYLLDKFQGIGFLMLLALIALLFRGLISKWLNKMTSSTSTEKNMSDSQEPSESERQKPPGSHGFARILKKLLKLSAITAFFAFLIIGKMELKVAGEFIIYPTHNADLRAEVEGIIETIYIKEGDAVKQGDPIARLSDREYQAELRDTQAHILEKQASIETTNEELKYANKILRNYQKLGRQQALSQNRLDSAIRDANVKKNEVKETRAEISRLETHKAYLEEQLVLLDIISPIDGIVTTPKTSELLGRLVKKGDLIVEVHQNRKVLAEIIISEKDIADVEIDDEVVLKARAYPDTEFTGKVTAIAPKMDEFKVLGEKVIRVTTEIDNADLLLKTEMTGQGKIYCGERTIIDVMLRRLKRFIKVEFWSWW